MRTALNYTHDTVHLQLRNTTRALHEEIERAVALPDSVDTPDAYRRVLENFWGFHQPLEAALAGLDWGGFDFERRRRAEYAAADILALGASRSEIERLPLCPAAAPASAAEAWGVLYVLEGSTLGGRVIRRALEPKLGAMVAGACRFFDGRDGEGGPLWRSFLRALDDRVRTLDERKAAQAGAEATFRAMIAWFS